MMPIALTQGGVFWEWLIRSSWQAAVLVGLVLLVQGTLKTRLSARWRYNLWLIVLLRLAMPVVPTSPISVFNLLQWFPAANLPAAPTDALSSHGAKAQLATAKVPDEKIGSDLNVATRDMPVAAEPELLESSVEGALPLSTPQHALQSQSPSRRWDWRTILIGLWLVGVLALCLRMVVASLALSVRVRRLNTVNNPEVCNLLATCRREMGVRRPVLLLAGEPVPAPALMGFLCPRLLLPAHLLQELDHRELRLVFLHELGHVRRCDVAMNWLATLLLVLHWFNPALWLALARLRADRELACDELVLETAHHQERQAYGQTILKLLQNMSRRPALPGMVGILEGSHLMRRRITMIARFNGGRGRWSLLAGVAGLVLGAVALTDAVQGQAPEPQTSAAPVVSATTQPTPSAGASAAGLAGTVEARITDGALGEVLKMIGQGAGVNIIADWKALNAAGINERTPVSLNVKDVSLQDVLRLTLRQLGSNLTYTNEGGTLVITTAKEMPAPERAASPAAPITGTPAAVPQRPRPDVKTRFAVPEVDMADMRVEAALHRTVPEIKFVNIPFQEAIGFLREQAGINLVADWRVLEAAGIDPQAMVNIQVKDVPLRDVLRLILREAGGNLTYEIEGGVLTITTAEEAGREAIIKVYNVGDLVDSPVVNSARIEAMERQLQAMELDRQSKLDRLGKDHRDVIELDKSIELLKKQRAQAKAGDRAAQNEERRDAKMQQLVSLITETVDPTSWVDAGGRGSIKAFNTKLVIATTKPNHQAIDRLLGLLREKPAEGEAK